MKGSSITADYFDVNTTGSGGISASDITPGYHTQFPRAAVQKRVASRKIESCSKGGRAWYSECDYSKSAQAYNVTCWENQGDGADSESGACRTNEICVDGIEDHPGLSAAQYAWCVSKENFVDFTGLISKKAREQRFNAAFRPVKGKKYSVKTVSTAAEGTSVLKASSLSIQAQINRPMYGVDIWETLPGGSNDCCDCASVGIQPLPAGTQRIHIDAVLGESQSAGQIYLTSISI